MHNFIIVDNETIMVNSKCENNKGNINSSNAKAKLFQETMKLFDEDFF